MGKCHQLRNLLYPNVCFNLHKRHQQISIIFCFQVGLLGWGLATSQSVENVTLHHPNTWFGVNPCWMGLAACSAMSFWVTWFQKALLARHSSACEFDHNFEEDIGNSASCYFRKFEEQRFWPLDDSDSFLASCPQLGT